MALVHRWTGRDEAELLARVRVQCYGASGGETAKYLASVMEDGRCRDGEFLVVEEGDGGGKVGRAVGTAASLSMTMYHRGAAFPCHGVAYVGTIRTERRKGGKEAGEGVATVVMRETMNRARERGDVVTALIPFRASYYEHFGYGQAERQATWRIPTVLFPAGDTGRFLPYEPRMLPGLMKLRHRVAEAGACDLDRPESQWRALLRKSEGGFAYVDEEGGSPRGWVMFNVELEAGVQVARVVDWGAGGHADFARLLRQMGSWRDQYARVYLTTSADVPLNRMLRESQLPHRPVAHAHPTVEVFTRLQIRVLDHAKWLGGLAWPDGVKGEAVVSVRESEGHESRFLLRLEHGRASVSPSEMTPTFSAADTVWSSIACGELGASEAVRHGLAAGDGGVLDGLAAGPRPFTHEVF